MEREYVLPHGLTGFGHILGGVGALVIAANRGPWQRQVSKCRQPWARHEAELSTRPPVLVCNSCLAVEGRERALEIMDEAYSHFD